MRKLGFFFFLWLTTVPVGAQVVSEPPGGGFFLPETPLLMADGSEKTTEDLRPGDRVRVERAPGIFNSAVIKKITPRIVDEYTVIKVDNQVAHVAGKLAFLTEQRKWKLLDKLQEGDKVWVYDNADLVLKTIQQLKRYPASIRVYRVELEERLIFFASKVAVGD